MNQHKFYDLDNTKSWKVKIYYMKIGCIDDPTGGILIVIRNHQLDLLVEKLGIFIQMEEYYLLVKRCRSFFSGEFSRRLSCRSYLFVKVTINVFYENIPLQFELLSYFRVFFNSLSHIRPLITTTPMTNYKII